jgi:hypothetical protein
MDIFQVANSVVNHGGVKAVTESMDTWINRGFGGPENFIKCLEKIS